MAFQRRYLGLPGTARLVRSRSGAVTDVWLSATRLRNERTMAQEMRKRYRKSAAP